jgi:hypothetical protein
VSSLEGTGLSALLERVDTHLFAQFKPIKLIDLLLKVFERYLLPTEKRLSTGLWRLFGLLLRCFFWRNNSHSMRDFNDELVLIDGERF